MAGRKQGQKHQPKLIAEIQPSRRSRDSRKKQLLSYAGKMGQR